MFIWKKCLRNKKFGQIISYLINKKRNWVASITKELIPGLSLR